MYIALAKFEKGNLCNACQMEKQVKNSFKWKNAISNSRSLQLLYMDFFGPTKTTSLGAKRCVFVIVDDNFTLLGCYFFLKKMKLFINLLNFARISKMKRSIIEVIMMENLKIKKLNFLWRKWYWTWIICTNDSSANGVVERKNRSSQEMARTMLNENNLPKYFWIETVNTA